MSIGRSNTEASDYRPYQLAVARLIARMLLSTTGPPCRPLGVLPRGRNSSGHGRPERRRRGGRGCRSGGGQVRRRAKRRFGGGDGGRERKSLVNDSCVAAVGSRAAAGWSCRRPALWLIVGPRLRRWHPQRRLRARTCRCGRSGDVIAVVPGGTAPAAIIASGEVFPTWSIERMSAPDSRYIATVSARPRTRHSMPRASAASTKPRTSVGFAFRLKNEGRLW